MCRLTKAVLVKKVEVEESETLRQARQTELEAHLQELNRLRQERKQLADKTDEALESIHK